MRLSPRKARMWLTFALFVVCGIGIFQAVPSAVAQVATANDGGNYIELSVDQVYWAQQLSQSAFPGGLIWVPGDAQVGTLWVRTNCENATGRITWSLTPDAPPIWADDLLVRTRIDNGTWSDDVAFAQCEANTDFAITGTDPVRLDLEVLFPFGDASAVSVNDTQLRSVAIGSTAVVLVCDGTFAAPPAPRGCAAGSPQWDTIPTTPTDTELLTDTNWDDAGAPVAAELTNRQAGARGGIARTGITVRDVLAVTLLAVVGVLLWANQSQRSSGNPIRNAGKSREH